MNNVFFKHPTISTTQHILMPDLTADFNQREFNQFQIGATIKFDYLTDADKLAISGSVYDLPTTLEVIGREDELGSIKVIMIDQRKIPFFNRVTGFINSAA